MKPRFPTLFAMLLSLLVFAGCTQQRSLPESVEEETEGKSFTFTRGGAPVEVEVVLSSTQLELTDYLTVTIRIKFPENARITPPYLAESVYAPLLLVENPKQRTYWSSEENRMIDEWTFRFEPLASGEFTIKPFSIYFRLEEEKPEDKGEWSVHEILSEPIAYEVLPVEEENLEDIRDIKGLILPSFKYYIPLIVLLAGIGIPVLILLIIKSGKLLSGDPAGEAAPPDYYQLALERLEQLEQSDLISQEQFNRFHTTLADILREYVEGLFGVRAKEQTTEEFVKAISDSPQFSSDQRLMLNRFLRLADLVKFATFSPGSEISQEALGNVKTFIVSTGKSDEF